MSKFEERLSEFEVSILNAPIDLTTHYEVEPLTARQIADRRWKMKGSQDDENRTT